MVEPSLNDLYRSSAKRVISAIRCVNCEGLGVLSALAVLKRRRRRYGAVSEGEGRVSAEVANAKCAIDGGLKLESRM